MNTLLSQVKTFIPKDFIVTEITPESIAIDLEKYSAYLYLNTNNFTKQYTVQIKGNNVRSYATISAAVNGIVKNLTYKEKKRQKKLESKNDFDNILKQNNLMIVNTIDNVDHFYYSGISSRKRICSRTFGAMNKLNSKIKIPVIGKTSGKHHIKGIKIEKRLSHKQFYDLSEYVRNLKEEK